MNDSFSPGSFDDEYDEHSLNGTPAPEPEREKKPPAKKRKSWGQQLPEPKTHLPPRKRAKTEDEKEQRRVERVLRNRRAAQTSRERKRIEVEGLERAKREVEQRNIQLELKLRELQARNQQLEHLISAAGGDMTVFREPSAITTTTTNIKPEPLRCTTPTSITFSPELFPGQDSFRRTTPYNTYGVQTLPTQQIRTVNPASLSPEMRPVDQSMVNTSDMTQHPAVSVGSATMGDIFASQLFSSDCMLSNDSLGATRLDMGGYNSFGPGFSFTEDGFDHQSNYLNSEHDHMASYNLDEYIILNPYDENSSRAPEIRSSDAFVDKAFGLQPPVGASSFGCDAGSNAVTV